MVSENESSVGSSHGSSDHPIRFIDESDEFRIWGTEQGWSKQNRTLQLKRVVKYGVCLWWSGQIPSWIHPDDIETAKRLVPSGRVFRREECENFADRELGFSFLRHGDEGFRALPAIWMEIRHEGFELHDFVEVKSGYGKRFRGIGTIRDIIWNRQNGKIHYLLAINEQKVERPFLANELQPAIRLGTHLNSRELENYSRSKWT